MKRFWILILVISALLKSCLPEKENNLYIGSYRIFDQQIPHPYFFKVEQNQLTYLNNLGEELGVTKLDTALISEDTIALNKHLFYFKYVRDSSFRCYDLNDTVNYFYPSPNDTILNYKNFAKFRKIHYESTDLNEVKGWFNSKIWTQKIDRAHYLNPNSDLQIFREWQVNGDSIKLTTKYYYHEKLITSETTRMGFSFVELEDNVFISLIDEPENPLPIYQVVLKNEEEIKLIDYSSRYKNEIDLKIVEQKTTSENPISFSNCFEGIQLEYYNPKTVTYLHGNDSLQNKFNSKFPLGEKNEGYVIIQFNINCKRQVGNFGLIQMDFEFQPMQFSINTVAYLIQEVQKLKSWPSIEQDYWKYAKDRHAFLMLKIKSGKIIDVSP